MDEQIVERINKALDEIRPFLISDGGDVELVEVKNNKATVRFTGTCSSCSSKRSTLKLGVETTIKKHIPEIKEVVNVN